MYPETILTTTADSVNNMDGGKRDMSKVYGYVRVSSADQNEERQMIEMEHVGVPKENIYMDTV